jgi:hypothetical protein
MTFDPTGIAFTFDDVMVQNPPAWPAYAEHSLVSVRVGSPEFVQTASWAEPVPRGNA